jgi:DNA-binding transcriptional LysR family regulator
LEAELGVDLVHRTTRSLRFTEVGLAFAERCQKVVEMAREAADAVAGSRDKPSGRLRITADPIIGEALLPELVEAFLSQHPDVDVEAELTSRFVDLIGEGFDLAFRVGKLADSSLTSLRLAPARLGYYASPKYLASHGRPEQPRDLQQHVCIALAPGEGPIRWPFAGKNGVFLLALEGRLRVNSLAMAKSAALAGIGIANLPEFACAGAVSAGRLLPLLTSYAPDAGGLHLVFPKKHALAAKVRAFIDLCRSHPALEQLAAPPTRK